MFCQKCGQEQASESARYCSRCGFELNTVEDAVGKRLLMIAMYLLLTTFALLGRASIASGPNYGQIRVIITVIAAITFYLLFSPDLKRIFHKLFSKNIEQIKQVTSAHESALAPAQNIPVPTPGSRRVNTAEMAQPSSITEHTTRLLDENKR